VTAVNRLSQNYICGSHAPNLYFKLQQRQKSMNDNLNDRSDLELHSQSHSLFTELLPEEVAAINGGFLDGIIGGIKNWAEAIGRGFVNQAIAAVRQHVFFIR
jgi:hypothetical protein